MPTKTQTTAKPTVTTSAPILPIALATGQYHAAALCIIAAALETIAEQERSHVTPTKT